MTYAAPYPMPAGAALEEWLHQLDLAGPYAPVADLEELLAEAPAANDPTVRHLAGLVLGRRGRLPDSHSDIEQMAGVWAGIDLLPPAGGRP